MVFVDRVDAGRRLGKALHRYRTGAPVVIGLPRGGVPVALEVARALHAPLDVIVVRKLGVPWHEELGLGAIGEDGVVVFNDDVLRDSRATPAQVDAVLTRERATLDQRVATVRAMHSAVLLQGRTVIVVDDGIATGIDARAACRVARGRGALRVVLATPVAPRDWKRRLAGEADDYIALETPDDFGAVGWYYADFDAVDDATVLACLREASEEFAQ